LDSCGIFALLPLASIKSTISAEALVPGSEETSKLRVFSKGQGYPVASYVGGRAAFTATMASRQTAVAVDGRPCLPPAVQKNVTPGKFDAMGILFRGGAHMPLMVFLGRKSWRSPEALGRRKAVRQRHRTVGSSKGTHPPAQGAKGAGRGTG
jgi:hypothetical protein